MRILVTGGAGFIGSHVAELFLEQGHEVFVVDDLSSGREDNLPKGAAFYQLDIRSEEFSKVVLELKPEAIAHLAAQIDVRKSVADPALDADINILGTIRVVRAAAEAGARKVIFSSTGGAIYGEQDAFPATEEHPRRPVSPYGTSKLCAEEYLAYFRRAGGPAYVALRYANVYGPRQDPHGEAGVVAIFVKKMLAGQTPVINGDGNQTRDFVFARDVARSNLLALESDAQGVFNIGTGVETDINTLTAMLVAATGFAGKPQHGPAAPGEQLRSCVDPSLAKKVLNWHPEVDLKSGLEETVGYFRAHSER
jgi:UDP-glucose 4-epimerase